MVGNDDQTELSVFIINLPDIPPRKAELVSTSSASSMNRQVIRGEQGQTELSSHTTDEAGVAVVGNDDQTELDLVIVNLLDTPLSTEELVTTSNASSSTRKIITA
mgnify:CR=1 FL=1